MATLSSILAWRIPRDTGAWPVTVHGVSKSWTRLSNTAQHSTQVYIQRKQNHVTEWGWDGKELIYVTLEMSGICQKQKQKERHVSRWL